MKIKIGDRFGYILVIGRTYRSDKYSKTCWLCKCDCGNLVKISNLSVGMTRSCGCKRGELIHLKNVGKVFRHDFLDSITRFNEKWIGEPNSGCWLWDGAISTNGYGAFRFNNKTVPAHRASYMLFTGNINSGFEICHKCDTPSCVNPSHLFLGTHKDNMVDASRKGKFNYV